MTRPRTQRVGAFSRVPSYCYPARRQFPIRWFLTFAVAIAWLLVLEGQEGAVRFEPQRVVVLDTFEISLVGPELDAPFDVYRAAELAAAPAPAPAEGPELAEPAAPEARRPGALAFERASRSCRRDAPCGRDADREPAAPPVAALPATGPRCPSPPPSGDGPRLDAIAGSPDLASTLAASPACDRPGARDTAPLDYDCLRLCGRGPPETGALS